MAAVRKGRQLSDSEDRLSQLDRGWDSGQKACPPGAGVGQPGALAGAAEDAPPQKGTEDTLGVWKDSRVAQGGEPRKQVLWV